MLVDWRQPSAHFKGLPYPPPPPQLVVYFPNNISRSAFGGLDVSLQKRWGALEGIVKDTEIQIEHYLRSLSSEGRTLRWRQRRRGQNEGRLLPSWVIPSPHYPAASERLVTYRYRSHISHNGLKPVTFRYPNPRFSYMNHGPGDTYLEVILHCVNRIKSLVPR